MSATERPVLRVVHGAPTAEELAVVVGVLAAAAAGGAAAAPRPARSLWSRRARQIRPPMRPGPDAWRASTMPR